MLFVNRNPLTPMGTSSIIRLAALLAVCFFAGEAFAQNVSVGDLRRLTAPFSGPSVESYAIGYDGDTTETEEATSLYGFNGQYIKESSMLVQLEAEAIGKESFADCLECQLREEDVTSFSYELYSRELIY